MKKPFTVILIFLLSLLMLSCGHKEIIWSGTGQYPVFVLFEWDRASQASPEGMTLYFYSESTDQEIWKFDFAGREGGNVELPAGRYRMVAYNNDIPGIRIVDTDSFEKIAAESRNVNVDGTISSVGMLYGATVGHIEVTPCGVRYRYRDEAVKECPRKLIRCCPDSLTTIYNVVVRNIEGIDHAIRVVAMLKGVAEGITLFDKTPVGSPSEVVFPMTIDKGNAMFSSSVGAFAALRDNARYELSIIATLSDNKSVIKKFDVTQQILSNQYPRNVLIIIDRLSIPDTGKPGEDDSGIEVNVDGWETIIIDIDSNDVIST